MSFSHPRDVEHENARMWKKLQIQDQSSMLVFSSGF